MREANTCNKHEIKTHPVFNKPNVEIRFKELNSDFCLKNIEPIRKKMIDSGEIWERLYSVVNYTEVILNKLDHVLEVSKEENVKNLIWLDAGLFGTSCNNAWRDMLKDRFVHFQKFLDKIFEKIEQYGFICTKGQYIATNYEVKDRITQLFDLNDFFIIPGCLFGGKKEIVKDIFSNYLDLYTKYIQTHNQLISEQELLCVLVNNKDVKFFEFHDWDDLQKAFLKIMDDYREEEYLKDKCYAPKE